MEKPIKPIEPRPQDFPREYGFSLTDSPFVVAHKKYQRDLARYYENLELYEQTKLINFVKVADIKLILKKYKITKI